MFTLGGKPQLLLVGIYIISECPQGTTIDFVREKSKSIQHRRFNTFYDLAVEVTFHCIFPIRLVMKTSPVYYGKGITGMYPGK